MDTPTTRKRGPTSPDTETTKRQRNDDDENENTTYIYCKIDHFDEGIDATTRLNDMLNHDIPILGTKKIATGYLTKVYDQHLRRIIEAHRQFKPTMTTMNKKALCINKIDENINQNDLIKKIELALDQKIIFSTFENKLFLFLPENFKKIQNINISITLDKKTFSYVITIQ